MILESVDLLLSSTLVQGYFLDKTLIEPLKEYNFKSREL